MWQDLTPRQRQVMDYIRQCVSTRGYPPSVREIGESVGLRSSSTVHMHLQKLEEMGFIRRDPTKPRAIELLEDVIEVPTPLIPDNGVIHLPLLGTVTAGQPILASEHIEDYIPISRSLLPEEDGFVLRVKGESMIEAGILPGDLLIVKRRQSAENGEIVVALLEDEATVKRFFRERDHIRLQPENSQMEPIRTRNVKVIGKVVGLVRQY